MGATIQISTGGMPVTGSVFAAAGTVCTFSNLDNTGLGGWAWELVDKPAGSTAVLSSTTATTTQITVDMPGTYMVRLSTYLDSARTLFDATDLQGVGVRYVTSFTWRLPSAYETDQFDADAGWKEELNSILDQIRTALLGGGGGITQLTGDATAGPGSGSQAATVVQARGLRETSGPTTLAMGAVADGQFLRRVGASLVGGSPPGGVLLYDMPINTASVGTPVFIRDEGNNPASPGSTASASVVDIQAGPDLTEKALRLALSGGTDAGGWMFPVNTGALPEEGFVIEVVYSGMDGTSSLGGFLMPLAEFVGVTVEGLGASLFSNVYSATAELRITSSTYSQWFNGPALTIWPSSPTAARCDKGPHVQRIELRKKDGETPACWVITQTLISPDGSYVVSSSISGVSDPVTSLDGKTYEEIAIGPWVPGGYTPPAHIDIQSLRIFALES